METQPVQKKFGSVNQVIVFAYRHPFIFSFLLMGISGLSLFFCFKNIYPPPEVVTHHRFSLLETQIRIFLKENKDSKVSLQSLSIPPGYDHPTLDGWDHPILYQELSPGVHVLTSFGKDGVPGGEPDLTHRFKV